MAEPVINVEDLIEDLENLISRTEPVRIALYENDQVTQDLFELDSADITTIINKYKATLSESKALEITALKNSIATALSDFRTAQNTALSEGLAAIELKYNVLNS